MLLTACLGILVRWMFASPERRSFGENLGRTMVFDTAMCVIDDTTCVAYETHLDYGKSALEDVDSVIGAVRSRSFHLEPKEGWDLKEYVESRCQPCCVLEQVI